MGYRWRPYSDGHWVWTDYGWTWVSNQEWGDIPFHYGRWGWDDDIGWFWVPGTTWGPAWVSWRSNDQYMGWAPLPPGIEYREGFERNRTIVGHTSMHNRIYFRDNRIINEGIGIDEVRRFTWREVPHYALRDANRPGPARVSGSEIEIFRPSVRKNEAAKPRAYFNKDQARQEVAPAKIFEPPQPPPVRAGESVVRKRQNEEQKLLQRSQAQELSAMQRKRAEDEKRIRDNVEKAKVRQDYEARMSELRKSHQTEKQQLTERHRQGIKQVRHVQQARQQKPVAQGNKKNEKPVREGNERKDR
jgi:hypothetical protein